MPDARTVAATLNKETVRDSVSHGKNELIPDKRYGEVVSPELRPITVNEPEWHGRSKPDEI